MQSRISNLQKFIRSLVHSFIYSFIHSFINVLPTATDLISRYNDFGWPGKILQS